MNLLTIFLTAFFIIIFIIPFIISVYVTISLIFPKMLKDDQCISDSLKRNEYTTDILRIEKDEFEIESNYDYKIRGFILNNNSDKTVIFVHGITASRVGMYKYYSEFIKNGWNICGYDHRHHGKSDGGTPSFGYYEKYDLKSVSDFVFQNIPSTKKLLVYGESMGAATVLQYLPLDKRVTAVVVDSPYNNMKELIFYHLHAVKIPIFFDKIVYFLSSSLIRILGKFSPSQVNPQKSLLSVNVPVLFFHSSGDKVVPSYMSEIMNKKYHNSDRFEIECEDHTLEIVADRNKYVKKLKSFLRKNIDPDFK